MSDYPQGRGQAHLTHFTARAIC